MTLSLREAMIREAMTATTAEGAGDDSVRMGINLGPVKLVKDINGHPNIIGDGINVAQRIMSFARPGQIVVSRSYYDVVSNLAERVREALHTTKARAPTSTCASTRSTWWATTKARCRRRATA